MVRSRVKLSLIADKTSRRTTFKKRKGGIMKKLNELVTLCGVKACAVVYNGPNDSNPEAWPSKEGAEAVLLKFMEFPEMERAKKMYDQEAYTLERIVKEQATLKRLQDENREFELKEFMFDLLKGKKKMEYHYHDANVVQDLSSFIDYYVNEITKRIQMLQGNDESISFPPLDVSVVDATHPPDEDVSHVAVPEEAPMPFGFLDHIQNMDMNVNQQAPAYLNDHIQYQNMNQQELVPYQVPTNFPDNVQYQNMNHQDQFQYQVPDNVYDQNQNTFHGLNLDMSYESFNEYPNLNQPFMNQWVAQPQQMSYAEELARFASMDDNYHQLPTASHMPSMDFSAPNTNNNVWPTRFGLE